MLSREAIKALHNLKGPEPSASQELVYSHCFMEKIGIKPASDQEECYEKVRKELNAKKYHMNFLLPLMSEAKLEGDEIARKKKR